MATLASANFRVVYIGVSVAPVEFRQSLPFQCPKDYKPAWLCTARHTSYMHAYVCVHVYIYNIDIFYM